MDVYAQYYFINHNSARPGFSLCAAPLELFGPLFQDRRGDRKNEGRGLQRGEVLKQIILMTSSN